MSLCTNGGNTIKCISSPYYTEWFFSFCLFVVFLQEEQLWLPINYPVHQTNFLKASHPKGKEYQPLCSVDGLGNIVASDRVL